MNAVKQSVTPSNPPLPVRLAARSQAAFEVSEAVPIASTGARNQAERPERSKRIPHSNARQAIAFESSVKLTVNLLLAVVATTTIAKLVPYYQAQQNRLTTLQASVETAEQKNIKLRSQFNRNFDPAQASRIMQEQSGLSYPNQKQVIWQSPLQNSLKTGTSETP
jgi:hypothetical protein